MDGIFNAGRYQRMLQRVAGRASLARFFAWDLSFDETVARHAHRADRVDFTTDEMADWYHGWQPLDFVDEERFDASVSIEDAVARVEVAIGTRAQR